MKYFLALIISFGLIASSASAHCGGCAADKNKDHASQASMKNETSSILETANKAGSFKTLIAAVEAAGLSDALSGEGPFTVFAPTDEAFAALPKGTIESLLKDKDKLASILTYHVVEGAVMAETVVGLDKAMTLNGQNVSVKIDNKKVMLDYAEVITTDIICSNGVIHVIDAVILPKMVN